MHRHHTAPEELKLLLPLFCGGPFIVKNGRGSNTQVYAGIAHTIMVPDPSQRIVVIACRTLCERWIGCDAEFSPVERWNAVPIPPQGLVFAYLWFYEQKTRRRLKLVAEHHDRCWLCSDPNSVQRELFSAALMKMFLEECEHGEPLGKRLRDWLLLAI